MYTDINNVIHPKPTAVAILHSLHGTYYWKVNRHKRLSVSRKVPPMFGVSFGRCSEEGTARGQQNCFKLKNYTGNNLLGLFVSRHSTFRMGSATLIERERETEKERE